MRMLARDWRGGELGVLSMALVLAVGVVVGISAFSARLQHALTQESHRFLAADLVVRSPRAMPAHWLEEARRRGLRQAQTLSFPSMVYAGDERMQLAAVKAVDGHYPLRGRLTRSAEPFGPAQDVAAGPARGEVWLESRLFPLLDVTIGDSIAVGEARFTVTAAARTEPDQGMSLYGFGPRVMMHFDDIPATGVVQPGSRVEYRQLFAGEPGAISAFRTWLQPRLGEEHTLLEVGEGQPGIGSALERAGRFLLLAGSLAVALAGVAIALAARRFSERHTDYVAIFKSLGAGTGAVSRLYVRSLLLLGVGATLAGCLLGWGLQALFLSLFADRLPLQPGPSGLQPYLVGAATALTCLFCFAWPPLRRLAGTSPLRVLRRELPQESRRTLADYALGLVSVALLMWWYSGDWKLTLALLAGLALAAVAGLALALSLFRGGRLLGMRAGSIWRLALAGLQRRGTANAAQVVIFAMAIMLLLVLVLVRTTLIDEWQTQLPADTPNHFMINISPDEAQAVEQTLRADGIPAQAFYPMIRGRIMAVNAEELPRTEDRSQARRQREVNFTWSDVLPAGNRLAAGSWWQPETDEALVSLEREFAERLGVEVGDRLSFLVGSEPLVATVASIRELDWQSMQPNFFLVFPPRLLADYPATFMTSFYLGPDEKGFLNSFIRQFPTVTVIEMDVVVEQIRAIVDQVSAAIELVLALILAAGAMVLVAGVQASVDARVQESALLRALGARGGLVLGGLLIEFAALGLCAGLLAVAGAELAVGILQEWAMGMHYSPSPRIWPLGLAAGVLLIGGLGVWSCRRVVTTPPLVVLREL